MVATLFDFSLKGCDLLKDSKNISQKVDLLIREKIEELGYVLWDVEYKKEGADYNLTVMIDKEGEVTLDDCVAVTEAINPILDEADPIEDSYYLEVSSAGLERELKKPEHFKKYLLKEVDVKLFAPLNELGKAFTATLIDFSNEDYTFKINSEDIKIDKAKVASIKNSVDYSDIFKNN